MAQAYEKDRKLYECQLKDMQQRLDEAETNALKGGKKAMNKMETRIRELESEMDAENRRFADAQKNLRKSERRIKELSFAADEDRKNHERMQGLIDQLQGKRSLCISCSIVSKTYSTKGCFIWKSKNFSK